MSLYLLFYRLLLKTLEIIPYKALFIGGKFLAFIFCLLPNNQRKITLANLKHAFPYKTKEDIDILLRDSLFHSIMTFLESGLVWGGNDKYNKDSFLELRNFESVKQSLKLGKGVLLFTPHLGNIEVLINHLGETTACTIPYTKPKNKYLDKIITESRNSSGVSMVNADTSGIKKILLELKAGNVVAIASDQVPKKNSGILSTFFEQECYSMTLLPKLQNKTNCSAHLMYCERKTNGRGFCLHFKDKIELPADLQSGVDKMNYEFEKCIMNIPGQYSWEYKKFKRTSSGHIY